jgi:hypothetical protein
MRLRWPPWGAREREPVSDISSRLSMAMGDPVVSALGEDIRGRFSVGAPVATVDPRQREFRRLAQSAFDARCWAVRGESRGAVVEPAIPVIYAGDRDAYFSSSCRIITVGLNPSSAEFPSQDPFRRFPLAAGLSEANGDYLAALDTYFKTEPRKPWFSSYESLLNGLDASYYPGGRNTALHTELCSPVATNRAWSKLGPETSDSLMKRGVPIWHELVRRLEPDVVLVSVARAHVARIEFQASEPFEISRLEEEGRSRPYVTEGRWLDIDGHRSLMVFGQASHRPFGLVSSMHKIGVGGRIADYVRRVRPGSS